jgi:hypothetical protein
MTDKLPSVSDACLFLGLCAVTWGAAQIFRPLLWIIPGLALIAYGVLRERMKP